MKKRIRASIVCIHNNSILVFKGVDPTTGREYWFLPGGSIEAGEKPWQCAEREALEETGYKVKALANTEIKKDYPFDWNGIKYDCTTYFYKGVLAEAFKAPPPVVDAFYNQGAAWLPLSEAAEIFSYTAEIKDAVLLLSKLSLS